MAERATVNESVPDSFDAEASFEVIDSHVHLDEYAAADPALAYALNNPSYRALIPGIGPERTLETLQYRADLVRFEHAAGFHPWYLPDDVPREEHLGALRDLLKHSSVVAIGEIGLDYIRAEDDRSREVQHAWFRAQLDMAAEERFPVVVHCVRAHGACVELLESYGDRLCGGVIHAYSGSPELAARYARAGFAVGIGSAVTRERSTRVRSAAAAIEPEWLLVETDAPWMNVGDGPRNEGRTENILEVIAAVAALREMNQRDLAARAAANYKRIFKSHGNANE